MTWLFPLFGPLKVNDDRGRSVRLSSLGAMRDDGERGSRATLGRAKAWKMLAASISPSAWQALVLRLLITLTLIVLLVPVAQNAWRRSTAGAAIWLRLAVVAAAALVGLWLLWREIRAAHRYQLALAVLRLRRCASCGYDLNRQAAEPDGCTVCSECGAAWRLTQEAPA